MGFKSKAQMAKFKEMLTAGKVSQASYDKHMGETKNPSQLPDRVGRPPGFQASNFKGVNSVKSIKAAKVIK